ncbi:polysaccharide biosynthesis protein [Pontibacter cellulosilyticus]|uniref:polysaccharide biosynthesis protein n=1 Tax=Pontibacter cellulosilyticus TaxID=1720253 RepID=UPI001E2B8B38|nr:nucleoside-diphosphate sugar epimerase/dehydratase [Pontibacter cellulosilyticus]
MSTFYAMRIHTGLIRYSSTQDVVRIFSGVFATSIIYSSLVCFLLDPVYHINSVNVYVVLLINFFISSSILVLLRIGAKNLFHYIKRNTTDKKVNVLIYGANGYSILVKQALETSGMGKYVIAGFVDENSNKVDKDIHQKRVYHINDIEKVIQRQKVDKLVVMSEDLRTDAKKETIERCVELGIKVVTVPPAEQWMSGQLRASQIQDLRIEDLLQRPPIVIENEQISADLCGKHVLITGAAGSIGSEIVRQALAYNPASVIIFDQAESPLHELQLEVEEQFPDANIIVSIGNIQNFNRMYTLFKEHTPDIVYHAAAYKHVPMMENNPSEAILTNVLGTKNLADLSMTFDVEKFVMISTDKAVNPTNIMGASKRIAEIYIQSLNNVGKEKLQRISADGKHLPQTKFITTRFGNVLGSNGSVIPRFRAQIERGVPITVTHPDITRYFMTIPEAVQLVLEAGTMGNGGEIFIFDMGEPVKIVDLAKKMIKLAGLTPGVDIDIVFTGLRPGEKLYEELLSEEETTIPTHHKKIKISKVRKYSYNQVVNDINELIALNKNNEDFHAVKKMKDIVPEFLSKNSKYEELDELKRTA